MKSLGVQGYFLLRRDIVLPKLGVFGYLISIEEATMGLFKIELSFYRWTTMTNVKDFNLLN
jgi:hypothetical protein